MKQNRKRRTTPRNPARVHPYATTEIVQTVWMSCGLYRNPNKIKMNYIRVLSSESAKLLISGFHRNLDIWIPPKSRNRDFPTPTHIQKCNVETVRDTTKSAQHSKTMAQPGSVGVVKQSVSNEKSENSLLNVDQNRDTPKLCKRPPKRQIKQKGPTNNWAALCFCGHPHKGATPRR